MKRIIPALLLITAAFTFACAELGFISAKADSFEAMIDQADRYMLKSDFEDAVALCKTIESEWDKSSGGIDTLLIHDYVDKIGESISRMKTYVENGSPDMYFAESTTAKKELASIRESEYPHLENIL